MAFALFSGSFGLNFLLTNLFTRGEPLDLALGSLIPHLLAVVVLALVLLSLWCPRPLDARERRFLVLPAAVYGTSVVRALWASPRGDLANLVGDLLQLLPGFWFALLLLATRFAAAADPGRQRERQQVALMSAALTVYPAMRTRILRHFLG